MTKKMEINKEVVKENVLVPFVHISNMYPDFQDMHVVQVCVLIKTTRGVCVQKVDTRH